MAEQVTIELALNLSRVMAAATHAVEGAGIVPGGYVVSADRYVGLCTALDHMNRFLRDQAEATRAAPPDADVGRIFPALRPDAGGRA